MPMSPAFVGYALDRLSALGIEHVFGVPGDTAFPLNDALEVHPHLHAEEVNETMHQTEIPKLKHNI